MTSDGLKAATAKMREAGVPDLAVSVFARFDDQLVVSVTLESLRGLFEGFIGSPLPVTVAFFSASMAGPNEQAIRSERSVATCALLPDCRK